MIVDTEQPHRPMTFVEWLDHEGYTYEPVPGSYNIHVHNGGAAPRYAAYLRRWKTPGKQHVH